MRAGEWEDDTPIRTDMRCQLPAEWISYCLPHLEQVGRGCEGQDVVDGGEYLQGVGVAVHRHRSIAFMSPVGKHRSQLFAQDFEI